MPIHRFYCPALTRPGTAEQGKADPCAAVQATLDADQTRHARKILRMNVGDRVEIFDGQGRVAEAKIARWTNRSDGKAVLDIDSCRRVDAPRLRVVVATALPKGPRAADMIGVLSQVGADALIPLQSERGAVDPRRVKTDRLERAAIEAAKQCGRAHLLEVKEPTDLAGAVAQAHDLRLLAAPCGSAQPDMAGRIGRAGSVLILVGPEGGWTLQESALAEEAGCTPWRIGPLVMRIETACAAAVAVVRYLEADD